MPTILDIATSEPDLDGDTKPDFDILAAALSLFPDLVDAAGNEEAELTVFAPTDQAFLNLANALNPAVGDDENAAIATLLAVSALLSPASSPLDFLKTVLTYHIAGEALTGEEVVNSNSIDTLSGDTIRPNGLTLRDKDPDFADPNVTNPAGSENGIEASNGIIHVLDNVLLPFDITISDGGFTFAGRGQDIVVGAETFDFISLGRGDDIANGLGGNDIIHGGRGNDLIKGGAGNDILKGDRGHDTLEGGSGWDLLKGGRGKDYLDGGSGNDALHGDRGSDMLKGGEDNDYLNGGRGADSLEGEEGNDFLVGGRGPDSFIFNPFRDGEGNDVVADFNPNSDQLVLDLRLADDATLGAIAEANGEDGLQFTDFLFFDTDPADGLQAAVVLGDSGDGDLLITHPTGTIELNGIPSDVDPADLLPAIHLLTNEGLFSA